MKPCLLLSLIFLSGISCKKEPAAGAEISTSESAETRKLQQIDPTPVSLLYYISDAEMRKLTLGPPDEDDPFAGSGADYKHPSRQLAKAGLPLPEGASATRVYDKVILNAPQSYHDQVAALLGVKGMQSPKLEDTSADPKDSPDR